MLSVNATACHRRAGAGRMAVHTEVSASRVPRFGTRRGARRGTGLQARARRAARTEQKQRKNSAQAERSEGAIFRPVVKIAAARLPRHGLRAGINLDKTVSCKNWYGCCSNTVLPDTAPPQDYARCLPLNYAQDSRWP